MHIAIVGTGYVGLVTGACFAELGHQVVCMDTDAAKVALFRQERLPFYEVGLPELVSRHQAAGALRFTTELSEALSEAEAVFLSVGTPPGHDGQADLSMLLTAAAAIGRTIAHPLIIVQKSTAPVGTVRRVSEAVGQELDRRGTRIPFAVVSNPEFLREGSAVHDFLHPDRVVVGGQEADAVERIAGLYAPLVPPNQIYRMDAASAEMAKYAANSFLAARISLINEIANLCEVLGADVEQVRRVLATDHRIGPHFLSPGAGYGGSCFPKDVQALIRSGESVGYQADILQAVDRVNLAQRRRLVERIVACLGVPGEASLRDRRIAIWGLAFKPGTDDMREAPAQTVIADLVRQGVRVRVYDPVAMATARSSLSEVVEYAPDAYTCVDEADAVVLLTEWEEFKTLDLAQVRTRMAGVQLFDGRNALDADAAVRAGLVYHGIGRPQLAAVYEFAD